MTVISTKDAPEAIGPYSQGYISGGFIFTSGQIAAPTKAARSEEHTSELQSR